VSDRLERDSVFIDVGANIGYYAVTVGSLLRKLGGGRVYAFEPNPAPYGLLSESIQQSDLADLVKAFPAAIGRADQDAIALYLAADGNSALSATKPWPGHLESGVLSVNHHINVYCRSLDSFVAEQRITRIDWLKIDVETAEREVLEGMASILDVMPPAHIICETSLDGEVSSLLRSKAYDSLLLERIDPTLDNWGNVLFVRDTVSR
jgi:FkbM family methyltransferase